ncbi:MAG: D-alanyl-D-alanine carboxypeptidase, partial [Pseudomonadota bacterium]|nr:D-alanyl-D-alanine carboxypeptidase [Pseudomonadota bacterium]
NGPIEAPIAKGQPLAELVLMPEDLPEMRIPLVAEADVPEGGFGIRLRTAAGVLMQQFGLNLSGAT